MHTQTQSDQAVARNGPPRGTVRRPCAGPVALVWCILKYLQLRMRLSATFQRSPLIIVAIVLIIIVVAELIVIKVPLIIIPIATSVVVAVDLINWEKQKLSE